MDRISKEGTSNSGPPLKLADLVVSSDDCFGKMWQLTNPSCLKCSSYDLCMVVFMEQTTKGKSNKLKNKVGGNFLDELNWDLVPWSDIKRLIQENPKKITLNEVRNLVRKKSKANDEYTVICRVQDWLIQESIKIESGCLFL